MSGAHFRTHTDNTYRLKAHNYAGGNSGLPSIEGIMEWKSNILQITSSNIFLASLHPSSHLAPPHSRRARCLRASCLLLSLNTLVSFCFQLPFLVLKFLLHFLYLFFQIIEELPFVMPLLIKGTDRRRGNVRDRIGQTSY